MVDGPYLHIRAKSYPIANQNAAATGNENTLAKIAVRPDTNAFRVGYSKAMLYDCVFAHCV